MFTAVLAGRLLRVKVELKCCVMLQKEVEEGLTEEECGRAVEEGHAGLCE